MVPQDSSSRSTTLRVMGGRRLDGVVQTSGFKHSMVTILSAAALGRGTLRLLNCPDIAETSALVQLLRGGGARVERDDATVTVDASTFEGSELDEPLAAKIHGSIYLLPALLQRKGVARVPYAGGCRIGAGDGGWRPSEHYLEVLRRFGATTREAADERHIEARADRLRGCEIDLLDFTTDRELRTGPLYSGASKLAILCAAFAEGASVLRHPYPKPDVLDLIDAIEALGAEVERRPDDAVVIVGRGGATLTRSVELTLVPDLIEVVTWIVAGATRAAAPLRILGPGMERAVRALQPELDVLRAMGVELELGSDHVVVHPAVELRPARVVVASCGVYSDAQPLLAVLACHANGRSVIQETVWTSRFGYAEGLAVLGASVHTDGATLRIDGPCVPRLPDRTVEAMDLRAAAALLLAAIGVEGPTVIHGAHHLERGYGRFLPQLRALGAHVERVHERP